MSTRTLTIALWAGPGVGKSVTAANAFVALKLAGLSAELVTEYAKDLQYEGRLGATAQLDVLSEQLRRLRRVQGHVQVAVTDAPLHVSQAYATSHELDGVKQFLDEQAADLRIWNVLLQRDIRGRYETVGRWQSEAQAYDFHHNVIAPHARRAPGERFLELQVETAATTLRDEVAKAFRP